MFTYFQCVYELDGTTYTFDRSELSFGQFLERCVRIEDVVWRNARIINIEMNVTAGSPELSVAQDLIRLLQQRGYRCQLTVTQNNNNAKYAFGMLLASFSVVAALGLHELIKN